MIIVGSGPAGVSAAFPLVEAGLKVLMVDGGKTSEIDPPSKGFLEARFRDDDQWKWMVGEDFHVLREIGAVSPKLRAPTLGYVFKNFLTANHISANDFVAVGSLASGGLSNGWGCGVARLSPGELSQFPVSSDSLDRSYEVVATRMGISGSCDDDLSDYFGVDSWAQPPVPMDRLHQSMSKRYERYRKELSSAGFRLGRSRVAALSRRLNGRGECNTCGNCLWGCSRRSLYSALYDLEKLRRFPTFHYEAGYLVESISKTDGGWLIHGMRGVERQSVAASRIFLAAGTLATTRLALGLLSHEKSVPLQSCPSGAFMIWFPAMLGAPREPAFGLGQLSFTLRIDEWNKVFGSTFGTTGIPVSEFLMHIPMGRRSGIDLLGAMLSSCLVGNVFLPGHLSASTASLAPDGSLSINGAHQPAVGNIMQQTKRRLRNAFFRLGGLLLPKSFTVGSPGGDIHYAGTLPMKKTPKTGETNTMGELSGAPGIHAVDGAVLPMISEKSHTLTLMANADRIARMLVEQCIEA